MSRGRTLTASRPDVDKAAAHYVRLFVTEPALSSGQMSTFATRAPMHKNTARRTDLQGP